MKQHAESSAAISLVLRNLFFESSQILDGRVFAYIEEKECNIGQLSAIFNWSDWERIRFFLARALFWSLFSPCAVLVTKKNCFSRCTHKNSGHGHKQILAKLERHGRIRWRHKCSHIYFLIDESGSLSHHLIWKSSSRERENQVIKEIVAESWIFRKRRHDKYKNKKSDRVGLWRLKIIPRGNWPVVWLCGRCCHRQIKTFSEKRHSSCERADRWRRRRHLGEPWKCWWWPLKLHKTAHDRVADRRRLTRDFEWKSIGKTRELREWVKIRWKKEWKFFDIHTHWQPGVRFDRVCEPNNERERRILSRNKEKQSRQWFSFLFSHERTRETVKNVRHITVSNRKVFEERKKSQRKKRNRELHIGAVFSTRVGELYCYPSEITV